MMISLQNFRFFAIASFILLGLLSRLYPHFPNFTAVNALALFGVSALGSLNAALISVFLMLFLSDLVLGFHAGLLFVYLSFGFISCIGYWFYKTPSFLHKSALLIVSSILFFLITNFGVWLTGTMYAKSLSGLGLCYLAGLPFLANQMIGDFFYSFLLLACFSYFRSFISGIQKPLIN